MNLKKNLLHFFQKNTHLASWLYSIYKPHIEKEVATLASKMSNYDTIEDISILEKLKFEIIHNSKPFFSYNLNQTSSRLYGIHSSIFKNITDKNIYFPSAEHGLIFHNSNWSDTQETLRACCLTFGDFRKSILQKFYKTPIFCIGPYIHYADDYYTEEQFNNKKKELGKNLLVFPTHSTDDSSITYDQANFVDKIVTLKKDFDSISVCIFWWNVDDPIVKILQNIGCHIVSAGYREDKNFLPRLKTIIKLSDFTIGDSIGTHIGYCLYLNKPFSYFSNNTNIEHSSLGDKNNQDFINKHLNILKKAFLNSTHITLEQVTLANYYWGFDQIKSNKEIEDIYKINKIITKNCYGFIGKYEEYINSLLKNKDSILSEQQIILLKKSL
nr:hypothetical protein [Acinetobacter sp. Marseille-Q1620]